jgi:dTDP-4-dehydrorhamnose reductase
MTLKHNYGQYFTNDELVNIVLDKTIKHVDNFNNCLEPSYGDGSFVYNLKQRNPELEIDAFEITDTYSESKILGEKASSESMIIRSSIVGKEKKRANSLLNWLLSRPLGSEVNGFSNHLWNGVTTLHFSEVVLGVIKNSKFQKGVTHLVPENIVSKFELIQSIAVNFGRADLKISEYVTPTPIDRSLITRYPEKNLQLWHDGGYNYPPSIEDMIKELAGWIVQRRL